MTITELFLLEKESSMRNTASLLRGRELIEPEVEPEGVAEPTCCMLDMAASIGYRRNNNNNNNNNVVVCLDHRHTCEITTTTTTMWLSALQL